MRCLRKPDFKGREVEFGGIGGITGLFAWNEVGRRFGVNVFLCRLPFLMGGCEATVNGTFLLAELIIAGTWDGKVNILAQVQGSWE